MSQNVTKCHTFSNLWYKATFTFLCLDPARNGSHALRLGFAERCISDQQTYLSGLLSTIIRGRERADQKSAYDRKIAQAISQRWTPMTWTSARGVTRTSTRLTGHPARGREPLRNLFCFEIRNFSFLALTNWSELVKKDKKTFTMQRLPILLILLAGSASAFQSPCPTLRVARGIHTYMCVCVHRYGCLHVVYDTLCTLQRPPCGYPMRECMLLAAANTRIFCTSFRCNMWLCIRYVCVQFWTTLSLY